MQLFNRNPFKKTLLKCYSLTKTTEITHDLDLNLLNDKIKTLLSTDNQILKQVSSYYFKRGKHMRPLLVLLVAQATATSTKYEKFNINQRLNDIENPIEFDQFPIENNILESQKRLSEITEMIHTASLLHDDVIDNAKTRRNDQSANEKYGNKMAVLAGDFLLSRACVALSRLRNLQVVELLSTVISNLVEGEFMQLRNSVSKVKVTDYTLDLQNKSIENDARFKEYLEKSYLKTASLISLSLKASCILGGASSQIQERIYNYGKYLGLAFQIIDDVLDFTGKGLVLGKPIGQDLELGLCTAPVYYASLEYPELENYIKRNFSVEGDVDLVKDLVLKSNGLEKSKDLAKWFCHKARNELDILKDSEAKKMLIELTETVITRTK